MFLIKILEIIYYTNICVKISTCEENSDTSMIKPISRAFTRRSVHWQLVFNLYKMEFTTSVRQL